MENEYPIHSQLKALNQWMADRTNLSINYQRIELGMDSIDAAFDGYHEIEDMLFRGEMECDEALRSLASINSSYSYFVRIYKVRILQRAFRVKASKQLKEEMMALVHSVLFYPSDPLVCGLIADLILNYRCNHQSAVSPKNRRYAKRLIMAGSCFLFSSFSSFSSSSNTKCVLFKEEEFAENKEDEELDVNVTAMEETELIHQIWGCLKCSLLMMQFHRIQPFEPNTLSLIMDHIDQILDHFHHSDHLREIAKSHRFTAQLIHHQHSQWTQMYVFFVFFLFFFIFSVFGRKKEFLMEQPIKKAFDLKPNRVRIKKNESESESESESDSTSESASDGDPPRQCPKCGKMNGSECMGYRLGAANWWKHIKSDHKWQCLFCPLAFATKMKLEQHHDSRHDNDSECLKKK